MNEVKKNFSKWLYWFILAVAIIAVYKFFDNFTAIGNSISHFFDIVTPFLSGALIAYLLYIPASRIEKGLLKSKNKIIRKRARGLSVFLTIVIVAVILIIIVNVILPVVTKSVVELVNNLQNYWNKTIEKINQLPEDSILKSERVKEVVKTIGDNIQSIDFTQYVSADKITEYIKGAVGVASGIFDIFVTIVVSVYILLGRTSIQKFFEKLGTAIFNQETCNKIGQYLDKSNHIFFKFISSQLIDAVIVGVLVTIAMRIIGVKYAILLGFIIGLFNIIPYFGAIIAVAISILITLITGGFTQALIMAIVVIILQQIDANIINPKIIGNSLEISPLLVIFAVTVGGAYFGVLGMFLAVPVIAILKIAINDYIELKISMKKEHISE